MTEKRQSGDSHKCEKQPFTHVQMQMSQYVHLLMQLSFLRRLLKLSVFHTQNVVCSNSNDMTNTSIHTPTASYNLKEQMYAELYAR